MSVSPRVSASSLEFGFPADVVEDAFCRRQPGLALQDLRPGGHGEVGHLRRHRAIELPVGVPADRL